MIPAAPSPVGPVPADSAGNWVDRYAPAPFRPYLRLARADRPIGSWLLLIPCWWSLALALRVQAEGGAPAYGAAVGWAVLFAIGAVAMRGAGCTWNDILDRDIDGRVERTRSRPLPAGQVTLTGALVFLALQLFVGLGVLLCLPLFAIGVALSSLGLVVVYPLMKRVMWIPQLVLGLAFSWGALMGFAVLLQALPAPAFLLYAGAVLWVVGYDTIYAHQDREDDAVVGVKSSALLFGARTGRWLAAIYASTVVLIGLALASAGAGPWAWGGLGIFTVQLANQLRRLDIDDRELCLRLFRSNRDSGLILLVGLVVDALLA